MSRPILYISGGHGGRDAGAKLGSRLEKTDNLKMAKRIKELLQANTNIEVRMARESDIYKHTTTRASEANAIPARALLSLHRNAFNGKAYGTEVWVRRHPSSSELKLAEILMGRLASAGTTGVRGIKKGSFNILERAGMPAVMVENLFIDNPADNRMYDQKFEAYAETLAKGMAQYFGVVYADNPKPKEYIRVQLGAFENTAAGADNAARLIKDLEAKGVRAWRVMPDNPKNVRDN